MPKKRQPRNAFYFFMIDYKHRCERNGEKFPNGLADIQDDAGLEWNVMNGAARQKYELMAKEERMRMNFDGRKQTSLNTPYGDVDDKTMVQEFEKLNMNGFIESTIKSLSNKHLLGEYKFYFIHVNFFCISDNECYHPAEIALAEFSLLQGVSNVYHTIVDPGQMPMGFRHDAQEKSGTTHKIPIEDNGGERDFYKILTDITKFIQPGAIALRGEYPPMFTMPDNVNLNTSTKAVKSVIATLCLQDPYEVNTEKYRIYPLEKLFLEIHKHCCSLADEESQAMTTVGTALTELERDIYNYTQHIACNFHLKEDVVEYCSKSYVQRWVFLICDLCCQYLDIPLVPSRHVPESSDVNYNKRKEMQQLEMETRKPKKFTWTLPASQDTQTKPWIPVEEVPLPKPKKQANLAAMLPNHPANPGGGDRVVSIGRGWLRAEEANASATPLNIAVDNIDLHFPPLNATISLGRGRGRGNRGINREDPAPSFASAMKRN